MTENTLAAVRIPRPRPSLPLVPLARTLARTALIGQVDARGHDLFGGQITATASYLRASALDLQAAGWLHLVLARTEYTTSTLITAGLPVEVVHLVSLLTPSRHEGPLQHARRVADSPEARKVLLAALTAAAGRLRLGGLEDDMASWRDMHAARSLLLNAEVHP